MYRAFSYEETGSSIIFAGVYTNLGENCAMTTLLEHVIGKNDAKVCIQLDDCFELGVMRFFHLKTYASVTSLIRYMYLT